MFLYYQSSMVEHFLSISVIVRTRTRERPTTKANEKYVSNVSGKQTVERKFQKTNTFRRDATSIFLFDTLEIIVANSSNLEATSM